MNSTDPNPLAAAYDPAAFRALAADVTAQMAAHLDTCIARKDRPVMRHRDADALLAEIPMEPPRAPGGPDAVATLLQQVLDHAIAVHHPRCIGHQVAAPPPAAALAESVASLTNNGMAVFEMGQMNTALERRFVGWLCDRLGYGPGAGGVLVNGGSLGNLTALLAARQAMSLRRGGNAWRDGEGGGPHGSRHCVLVSEQSHYCVDRAVRILGMGSDGIVTVPTDRQLRMDPAALPAALQEARRRNREPIAVVANACSTATGTFDPLPAIADFCSDQNLWMHVDGAHGASLALSSDFHHLVDGIERADSVVWDAHKTLLMPALITGVLYKDERHGYGAFQQDASYLFDGSREAPWEDIGNRTVECTKRGMGTIAWATLHALGTDALRSYLDRLGRLTQDFADAIETAPDFELALRPQYDIACFRYRPDGGPGPGPDLDALQRDLRARLLQSGRYYITQTRLHRPGEEAPGHWLRVTVLNPLVEAGDLIGVLDGIRGIHRGTP